MIEEFSFSELKKKLGQAYTLVDVREQEEVDEGMIPGSQHWPLSTFEDYKAKIEQSTEPLVFYCRSGKRSMVAAKMAEQWTGTNIYSLAGGYIAFTDQD